MSFGMLLGPGALPLVNRLRQLSYISLLNCLPICVFEGPLLSSIMPWCVCTHACLWVVRNIFA